VIQSIENGFPVKKDKSGNPVSKTEESPSTRQPQHDPAPSGISPTKEADISRFQKRRLKIGTAKAARETGLTFEEVCSILQKENQEAMGIAVEAWDKLLQVRLALIAMRGNLNNRDLERIIKDIGTIVSPFPGVNSFNDE
jgi:hypothetical protein